MPLIDPGGLEPSRQGARALEQMARNPHCLRLAAACLARVEPASLCEALSWQPPPPGSTLALQRGNDFEAQLLAEGCQRLLELYQQHPGVELGEADQPPQTLPKGAASREQRLRQTRDWVLARARGQSDTPSMIAHAWLHLQVGPLEFSLEPDLLVAAPGGWRVAEIKSYPDLRSLTDRNKTGAACRQAALGVLALRQILREADVGPSRIAPSCDLIYARASGRPASLHPHMDLGGELANLEASLERVPEALQAITEQLGGGSLSDGFTRLPAALHSSCAGFCPYWQGCLQQGLRTGDPALLGAEAVELLHDFASTAEVLQALQDGDPRLGELRRAAQALDGARQGVQV